MEHDRQMTHAYMVGIDLRNDLREGVTLRDAIRRVDGPFENEYMSIKSDFLAKTSSEDDRVRLFYFVFAVLLYNIWRLTDFLLKAGVDGEMNHVPVLTAGECVEIVVSALIPPD